MSNTSLKVPSFFKNDISEAYMAILHEEGDLTIYNLSNIGKRMTVSITTCDRTTINDCLPFMHEISEQEFSMVLFRCIDWAQAELRRFFPTKRGEIPEGRALKNAIRGKGITILEAAETLGLSRTNLQYYLNKDTLSGDFKQKVKSLLNIDIHKVYESTSTNLNRLQRIPGTVTANSGTGGQESS